MLNQGIILTSILIHLPSVTAIIITCYMKEYVLFWNVKSFDDFNNDHPYMCMLN